MNYLIISDSILYNFKHTNYAKIFCENLLKNKDNKVFYMPCNLSVTTNKWYFSYLKSNIDTILLDIEQPIKNSWLKNTGLFAVKINKK